MSERVLTDEEIRSLWGAGALVVKLVPWTDFEPRNDPLTLDNVESAGPCGDPDCETCRANV